MATDFATEATLRALSPALTPLATESAIVLLTDEVSLITEALGAQTEQTILNEYGENLAVPSGVETTIQTYTVPALKVADLRIVSAWADVDAEYIVKVDGVQKAGGRTSIANPSFFLDMGLYPISMTAGQILTIRCLRQSPSLTLPFKSHIMGVVDNA